MLEMGESFHTSNTRVVVLFGRLSETSKQLLRTKSSSRGHFNLAR